MKRIITLLFLISTVITAKGNHYNSELNLSMRNGSLFTVDFDNMHFTRPSQGITIKDVNPGRHNITIYKMKYNGFYHAYPVVVYSGSINIPASSIVQASVKPHCLDITDVIPLYNEPSYCAPDNHPVYYGINDQEFNDLKYIISKKSFDSSRLAIAKDAVRNQNMNSRQISEILDLLSFDSSRLEFAKYAYRYVADPSSYYLTYDRFSFESSVTELIDYIDHNS